MAQPIIIELSKVKPPKELSFDGDIRANWRRFRREFEEYLTVSDNKGLPENMKVPIFLNAIGHKGSEIFNSLELSESDKWKLPLVLRAFERNISQKKNVVYERFLLHCRKQIENENFDSFFGELQFLVKTCEFGDLEESILRDHIVFGIRNRYVQEKLLNINDLNLKTAVEICRNSEGNRKRPGLCAEEASTQIEDNETEEVKMEPERRRLLWDKVERSLQSTAKFEACFISRSDDDYLDEAPEEPFMKDEPTDHTSLPISAKNEPTDGDDDFSSPDEANPVKFEVHIEPAVFSPQDLPHTSRQNSSELSLQKLQDQSKIKPQILTMDEKLNRQKLLHMYENNRSSATERIMKRSKPSTRQPFKCDVCRKGFSLKTNLNKHVALHQDQRHQCRFCNDSYATKEYLRRHEVKYHKESIVYQCDICKSRLYTERSFELHMSAHSNQMNTCEKCGDDFKTKSDLEQHIVDVKHQHQCNTCNMSFAEKEYLVKHILSHVTVSDENLARHTAFKKSEGSYQCNICSKSFISKCTLKTHMLTHSGQQGHQCDFCGKRFSKSGHFKQHMLSHKGMRPFKCNICSKTFGRKWNLNQHMSFHEGQGQYQCNTCGVNFTNRYYLVRHMVAHKDQLSVFNDTGDALKTDDLPERTSSVGKKRLHRCRGCRKAFTTQYYLSRHMLTHSEEKLRKCDICGKQFFKELHYRKHMKMDHQTGPPFKCNMCNAILSTKEKFDLHSSLHKKRVKVETPFHCEICNKGYPSKKSLKWHTSMHVDGTQQCPYCDRCFTRKDYLRKHLSSHENGPHCCEVCGNRYIFKESLARHSLKHQSEHDFKCEICNKSFLSQMSLKRHQTVHDPPVMKEKKPQVQAQCDICNKILYNKKSLEIHMMTHTGERPHQCHICSKCFSQRHSLNLHLLSHSGERPHQCKVCGKSFRSKDYIKKHMLIHTGVQPYSCQICDKRFTVRSNMNKHMGSHRKDQLHHCEICKVFVAKDYLKMHLCVNERPYQCDKCDKKFAQKDYLRKHMLTHNKE